MSSPTSRGTPRATSGLCSVPCGARSWRGTREGPTQRDADIEQGSGRPVDALVADVRATSARLEATWNEMTDEAWDGHTTFDGLERVDSLPFARWREVEVHHADLGLGYTSEDWPAGFVRRDLAAKTMAWRARMPMGLTELPAAALALSPAGPVGMAARSPRGGRSARGRAMVVTMSFRAAAERVGLPDVGAARRAAELQDRLTKPRGALGRLEVLGERLAAISGSVPPPVPSPAVVAVFAGDHGVVAEGVTPWPKEVTVQMVANFLAGGAAISVLARQAGATVIVVDVGVDADLAPSPQLHQAKVRRGTGNLAVEPAMSRAEAMAALDVGADVAARAVASGAACLVTGDMGIGNTTPSAALIAVVHRAFGPSGHRPGHGGRRPHARPQGGRRPARPRPCRRGRCDRPPRRAGPPRRSRDRGDRRLRRRWGRGAAAGRRRRGDRPRRAVRRRGHGAGRDGLRGRRSPLHRAGRHQRRSSTSASNPCSTWAFGSARAPGRAWRSPCSRRRRGSWARWRRSTRPA